LAHGHYNSSCCQKCHIQIGCAHLLHPTYTWLLKLHSRQLLFNTKSGKDWKTSSLII
jgi:hypothetical protein